MFVKLRPSFAAGCVLVVWVGFVVLLASAVVKTSYTLNGDGAVYFEKATHGWLSRDLWLDIRLPFYPLLIKAMGSSIRAVIALQDALYALGCLVLVWTLLDKLNIRHWLGCTVLASAVFVHLAHPIIAFGLHEIMAESVMAASLFVVAACFLSEDRRKHFWVFLGLGTAIALSREEGAAWVLLIASMGALEYSVKLVRKTSPDKTLSWRRAIMSFVGREGASGARSISLVVVVLVVGFVMVGRLPSISQLNTALRVTNIVQMRVLLKPEMRDYFIAQGMPYSPIVESIKGRDIGYTRGTPEIAASPDFQNFVEWSSRNAYRVYLQYLATHPLELIAPFLPGIRDFSVNDAYRADITLYDVFDRNIIATVPHYQWLYFNGGAAYRTVMTLNRLTLPIVVFAFLLCVLLAWRTSDVTLMRMAQLYVVCFAMTWLIYQGDNLECIRHQSINWALLTVLTVCTGAKVGMVAVAGVRRATRQ